MISELSHLSPASPPRSPTSRHDIAWKSKVKVNKCQQYISGEIRLKWLKCLVFMRFHEVTVRGSDRSHDFMQKVGRPCEKEAVEAKRIARSQGCHRRRNDDHGIVSHCNSKQMRAMQLSDHIISYPHVCVLIPFRFTAVSGYAGIAVLYHLLADNG